MRAGRLCPLYRRAGVVHASRRLGLLPLPLAGEGWGGGACARSIFLHAPSLSLPRKRGGGPHRVRGAVAEPKAALARSYVHCMTNGAAVHVDSARAACGGAGGVRGL